MGLYFCRPARLLKRSDRLSDQRLSSDQRRPSDRLLGWLLAASVVCFLFLSPMAIGADDSSPGANVQSVRDWLQQHNPELQALSDEAQAADARIYPAGSLPDPTIGVQLRGIDTDNLTPLPGNVGSTNYAVQQRFPLWGKRRLSREVARSVAGAAQLRHDSAALNLLSQAEQAYARYWHAFEATKVINRLITLLDQIEDIATVRYSLGMAAQQDSIRAQVERTSMVRRRIAQLSKGREAGAELNAVLGRAANAPLAMPTERPEFDVGSADLTDTLGRLKMGMHPAIRASEAMATAASSNVELERRNRFPDISVGVGLMQGRNGIDSYELMLQVEIPLQQRARRERERESRLLESAAVARAHATEVELAGIAGSAWARWDSAREQRELIEATLLPQADANFKSALASYQVGEVDFGTLLAALSEWQGADLARVDATLDELLSAATVRAVNGATR